MKFFITFVCLHITLFLSAQHYDFSHINNSDGLSSNQIEYIFKDSRGFVWFATSMGLNRYDGINLKVLKHVKNDSHSSPYDIYSKIQEDFASRLWLQYNNSFDIVYDLTTEAFIQNTDSILGDLGLPPSPTLIEIAADKSIFCCYNDKEIYHYDPSIPETKTFTIAKNKDSQNSSIVNLKISDDFIWILYQNGTIERINKESEKVDFRTAYFKEHGGNPTIQRSLFIDADQQVWLYPAVSDVGLAYYDYKTSKWNILTESTPNRLSSNFTKTMIQDKTGLIWIGTDHGGITIFDKKTNRTNIIERNIYEPRSLGQNSVTNLFCDDEGIVWAGTYKSGISFYHPDTYKFKGNAVTSYFNKKAEVIDCNRVYVDSQDNLWIGTDGQGLIRYNQNRNDIKVFENESHNPNSLLSNVITAIYEDHRQNIWIGSFLGGLNCYANGKMISYSIDSKNPNSLSSKSVYGLTEDDYHYLWIATLGGGIDVLDPTRKTFTNYNQQTYPTLYSDYILSIFKGRNNNLYFSSNLGINKINVDKHEITSLFDDNLKKSALTSEAFNCFLIDSRGLYWMASDKGLNIYNPKDKSLIHIFDTDGLPSDETVSLIEDNNGNIWMGTRGGLVHIYCQIVDEKLDYYITHFDEKDGLPSNVCNQNAIFKDKYGIIYVGLTKGYISFDPTKISSNDKVPQPQFTDLMISNQPIRPNVMHNGRVVIEKTISNLEEITLNYDETNFTIKFSALSFQNPTKNHYKYKLEGLDKEWTEVKNGIGSASYSNLNSGEYKLVVYASNGDNIWSNQPLEMLITVNPPYWFSWWAISFYLVIIFLAIWGFIYWQLAKQKREFEQAQLILEAQKVHEVDELKFKFFTNISHEFKTPLTLIMTPIEKLLKEDSNQEHHNLLTIVYRNAQNLLKMVNDILDFRKFDLNKMTLSLKSGNVIGFIKDVCQSFSSIATDKSINLTFTTFVNSLQMDFDAEKIEKIISNILSNAFKYTESGTIAVSIGIRESLQEKAQDYLSINVSDTGIGIEKQELNKIFDRFYRIENTLENNPQGTGIGLHLVSEYVKLHNGEISIESTVGKGTSVSILIPISNSDYNSSKHLKTIEKVIESPTSEANVTDKKNKSGLYNNLPTLLIVDDNDDFCRFIESLFQDEYHVATAHDGKEGYTIVLDQLPDIILCDVMMPIMDGYEFCRKVKADIRTSHIPIILLTAKSSEENQYSGIEAGADDYIAKPFNIDMLKLKITKIIERQKHLQSRFKNRIDVSPSEIEIQTVDEKFVEKAIAIVEENMDNPNFLVEDLCKEMGMSRVYFYKKILALTDKTPSEFIRLIRLKRAADLLKKSQLFVNEVAFKVGFNDPKYFRKYFKEEFGVTPNEYKKST